MANQKMLVWAKYLVSFMIGGVLVFSAIAWLQTRWGREERRVYKDINCVLQIKLKNDISYAQYCDKNGKKEIESNWPIGANSFVVVIDDYSWGSYECRVFFDTGDIFSVITTRHQDGKNMLSSFTKMEWPKP